MFKAYNSKKKKKKKNRSLKSQRSKLEDAVEQCNKSLNESQEKIEEIISNLQKHENWAPNSIDKIGGKILGIRIESREVFIINFAFFKKK